MKITRLLKRISAAAALTLALTALPAAAEDRVDTARTGSVTVTLKDQKGEAVPGGEITLYQVAKAEDEDGDQNWVLTNGFENAGVALGDLQSSTLADELKEKLPASAAGTAKTVGADGKVSFTELPVGVYLFIETKTAANYSTVKPFVVSVPLKENGTFLYDVDASPKVGQAQKETPSTETPPTEPTTPPTTPKLPQTGQLVWPIPVLAALGLLFFSLGWYLRQEAERKRI